MRLGKDILLQPVQAGAQDGGIAECVFKFFLLHGENLFFGKCQHGLRGAEVCVSRPGDGTVGRAGLLASVAAEPAGGQGRAFPFVFNREVGKAAVGIQAVLRARI